MTAPDAWGGTGERVRRPPIKALWLEAVIAAPIAGATSATIAVAAILASHMNRQGVCWPSEATIATEARSSERSTRRHVALLESAGLVAVLRRNGAPNTYRALSTTPATMAGVTSVDPGQMTHGPRPNGARTPAMVAAEPLEPVNDARARAREADASSSPNGRHRPGCSCSRCHYGSDASVITRFGG